METPRAGRRALLLVDLREDLARDAERVPPRRHTAIDRDGHEDLADLVARDAVLERAADVHLELVRSIERADHRQVEHAACLLRKPLAAPDRAPAVLRHELRKRAIEVVGRVDRFLDELRAEDGLSDFETLFKRRLIHG